MALAPHVKITARSFPVSYVVGATADDSFDFAGPFWAAADILVYKDGTLLDSSLYTISGLYVQDGLTISGAYGGGTVLFLDPVSNCEITIDRKVVVQRDTDFSSSAPLSIANLNSDLDKAVARDQDLEARIGDLEASVEAKVAPSAWANITGRPSNLLAFASLNGAANKVPYFTSAGAMALADFADGDLTGKANTDLANVADATMRARTLAVGGVVAASGEAGFTMPPRAANLGLTLRMNAVTGNIEGYTPSSGGGATDWSSLTGKPTTFEPITESVQDIVGAMVTAGSGISVNYNDAAATLAISYTGTTAAWADITGKPSTFEPTTESVQDIVGAFVVAGTGITIAYNDAANTLTFTNSGALANLSNTTLQAASGAQSLPLTTFFNRELTALKFIPSGLHAAILDRTSTTNVASYLQAALDELETRGGGLLLLEEGRYCIQTNLRIPSKVRIQGRGAGSTIIKALTSGWTNHASITGAFAGSNFLMMNKNWTASSLTDVDISIAGITLDSTGNGGGAHNFFMRYVDRVSATDCRFIGGGNGTAFLACRDTIVSNCHALDVGNCFYDHWDGAGYAKVIGCTGRGSPAQGIMFTATSTDYATRTSSNFIAIANHVYGVKDTVSGYGCGILINCLSASSKNYSAHTADNFVENCDIGIGFIGGGGNHTSTGDHIKDCSKVGVLVGSDDGGQSVKDVAIRSLMVTDCYATGGNPAVISVGASSQRIHLRDITFGGTVTPGVHVWFGSSTSGCTVDPISGIAASTTSVNNQAGSANTVLAYSSTGSLVVEGSDGSGAYTDLFAPGLTYRARVRDAGSLSFNGSIQASTTLNATTDISLGSSGLIVFGAGSGYWIQKLGADCYWREPSGPTIIKMN